MQLRFNVVLVVGLVCSIFVMDTGVMDGTEEDDEEGEEEEDTRRNQA